MATNDGKVTQKLSPLLGESVAIEELRDFIVGVSLLDRPVLLLGDAGTGKELAARKIHAVGRSARAPFVVVDCGELSESEVEDVLFDPGGDGRQYGVLRQQSGATCYLSRIEHLSRNLAQRLIRFLDEEPADPETHPRLVLGSEFSYDELYEGQILDPEFLDRISQIRMRIPPLRDRAEDVPILCHYQLWLNAGNEELEDLWREFQEAVLPGLQHYPWPGNVNELNAMVREFCLGIYEEPCEIDEADVEEDDEVIEDPAAYLAAELSRLYAEFTETLELEQALGRSDMVLLPDTDREADHVH
ncbi:MAG: sigma 54-interacting transcriptional regulator [Planctomycetota bacterium]